MRDPPGGNEKVISRWVNGRINYCHEGAQDHARGGFLWTIQPSETIQSPAPGLEPAANLDAHYLGRDAQLAEAAAPRLEPHKPQLVPVRSLSA